MEKSFPFNAVIVDGVPDRVYTAEDFAAERAAYVSNGVTAKGALAVSPAASGGMAVDIAAGMAVINGYTYENTATLTLPIAAADELLSRKDLAVLRLDLNARTMYCTVLCGVPAELPTAPVCTQNADVFEIPLAQVFVSPMESVIEESAVTDRRVQADYILNRLEVAELLSEYRTAMETFFGMQDAQRLVDAAKTVRTDAGAHTVLCGDGVYREAEGIPVELVRFTEDGTFSPAEYPSANGLYTVVIQGAGGSGGCNGSSSVAYCGSAGAHYIAANLPLDRQKTYSVTVGKGGIAVKASTSTAVSGRAGGASSFDGYTVPGGSGGAEKKNVDSGSVSLAGAQAGLYTAAVGTLERGADSLLGTGGLRADSAESLSVLTPDGYGAGGGVCGVSGAYSGAGGDGVVIVYGYLT